MNIPFYSHANKNHFQKKDFVLCLALKVKVFGTQNWPIRTVVLNTLTLKVFLFLTGG